jgi:hypothetical protein
MDSDSRTEQEEDDIGRLLRVAGARQALPAALQQRWEQQFRTELDRARARRTRRHRWMGLAAGLAAIAGALYLLQPPVDPAVPAIRVTAVSGSHSLALPQGETARVVVGETIKAGGTLSTGDDGSVAVRWGAYDLRINRDTKLTLTLDGVFLQQGELYASDDPGRIGQIQLSVSTPHGTIRDHGTQFMVEVRDDRTVTTVRRGAIELHAGGRDYLAEGESGIATRMSVDARSQVQKERVSPAGNAWQWIYRAAPAFDLDGKSAWEFLHWSVNQSGLELVFTTPEARAYARRTLLYGTIDDMDPESAVTPVLATTDLTVAREDGKLLVGLRH